MCTTRGERRLVEAGAIVGEVVEFYRQSLVIVLHTSTVPRQRKNKKYATPD